MAQNDEIILININGADRPGVTAALTEILAKNNAVILDIGQADIHNHLSLGILFQSTEGNSGDILKELLFKSYELDVNIRFNPITEQEYSKCRYAGQEPIYHHDIKPKAYSQANRGCFPDRSGARYEY